MSELARKFLDGNALKEKKFHHVCAFLGPQKYADFAWRDRTLLFLSASEFKEVIGTLLTVQLLAGLWHPWFLLGCESVEPKRNNKGDGEQHRLY